MGSSNIFLANRQPKNPRTQDRGRRDGLATVKEHQDNPPLDQVRLEETRKILCLRKD